MLKNEFRFVRAVSADCSMCGYGICILPASEAFEIIVPARAIDCFAPKDADPVTISFGHCDRHYFYRHPLFKHAIALDTLDINILPMETIDGPIETSPIVSNRPQSHVSSVPAERKPIAYVADDGSAIVGGRALAEMRNGFDRPLTIDEMCDFRSCELAHLPGSKFCPLHEMDQNIPPADNACEHFDCKLNRRAGSYFCTLHIGDCPPDDHYASDVQAYVAKREREIQNPNTSAHTAYAEPATTSEVIDQMQQTKRGRNRTNRRSVRTDFDNAPDGF